MKCIFMVFSLLILMGTVYSDASDSQVYLEENIL